MGSDPVIGEVDTLFVDIVARVGRSMLFLRRLVSRSLGVVFESLTNEIAFLDRLISRSTD